MKSSIRHLITSSFLAALASACAPAAGPQQSQTPVPLTRQVATTPSGAIEVQQEAQVADDDTDPVDPNPVDVHMYVMSKCPFAARTLPTMIDAVQALGPSVRFRLDYLGTVKNGEPKSLHGQGEVDGDMQQLCAADIAPDRYLAFVKCQTENVKVVPNAVAHCAEQAGINADQITMCQNSAKGKQLVIESFQRAKEARAVGSPTMVIGGTRYQGRRTKSAFLRAICKAHGPDGTPDVCTSMPVPPVINAFVLNDKRSPYRSTALLVRMLKRRLVDPNVLLLDISEPDGRRMYEAIGGGKLPLIVFDKTIDGHEDEVGPMARSLKPIGDYRTLAMGGKWNPKCADPGGCRLDECKSTLACRKETPKTLEVFVMSHCPYSRRAENAMKPVLKRFGRQIKFKVHYIASGSAQKGFRSMRGAGEVEEDLRGICAQKHYGWSHKHMEYMWCRNEDVRSPAWERCAKKGIRAQTIRRCAEGREGKRLLEQDIKLAKGLGITGSPTWVVNGTHKFNGLDAETVRKHLCKYNPGLRGCDKPIPRTIQPRTRPVGTHAR